MRKLLNWKFSFILIVLLILPILTSCMPGEDVSVDDNPPIDVNISGGSVTAVVPNPLPVSVSAPNPLPISGAVTIPTPVPVQQSVTIDTNNSSNANVNAGATFTGTATSTLGIVGIQVTLKTDQDCTVYVDQSPIDGLTPYWDINDTYNYVASLGGASWTVQAVNSYVRVRVTNVSTINTTYFRLQTALCPIVEAVPRSLNANGRFITDATLSDQYNFSTEMTPFGEMRTIEPVKLVGAAFIGTTLDGNFWQNYTANGATVTQGGGQVVLATNTTANAYVTLSSLRRARYVVGASMRYRGTVQLDSALAGNTRRWGIADWTALPTILDGAYFKLAGTTFAVATLKTVGGVTTETAVNNGSFNGKWGATYTLDTNAHTYEIYYTDTKVYFVIDDKILHTVTANTATWTSTLTLYIGCDNFNTGAVVTNKTLTLRAMSISRLGKLESAPNYKHISTATTTVCKLGAGTLHSIIVNQPTNNAITVYDNTSGGGTVIAIMNPQNNTQPFELHYDLDFYTGLVVVTAGLPDLDVVYE